MALNAYTSSQTIDYHTPKTFFGWYVTGSSFSDEVAHFESSEQREAFRLAVATAGGVEDDGWARNVLPALIACQKFGNEYASESMASLAVDQFPEGYEAASEAADKFIQERL